MKYLIISVLFFFTLQSCTQKENRLSLHIKYKDGEIIERNRYSYNDEGLIMIASLNNYDKSTKLSYNYFYTDTNLDSIIIVSNKEIIGKLLYDWDSKGRVVAEYLLARASKSLKMAMETKISYFENTKYPDRTTKHYLIEDYSITQEYKWENGNCTNVTTIIGNKDFMFDIEYDDKINPLSTINNAAEYRYKNLSKNNPLKDKENPDGLFYEYSLSDFAENVYTEINKGSNSLRDVYQMEEVRLYKAEIQTNKIERTVIKTETLGKIDKPILVCDKQYMEVSKDTYDYYMKKLGFSGLASDVSIQRKLKIEIITCFLSLTDYGESENVIFEPITYSFDDSEFFELRKSIEKSEKDGISENVKVVLLESGKGNYAKNYSYYYFLTEINIKKYDTKRYSYTYFISINNKSYLLTINTYNIDNCINKAVLSINGFESNKSACYKKQKTKEDIKWSDKKNGIFIDVRDSTIYPVVRLGKQVWFAKNLAFIPIKSKDLKTFDGVKVYNHRTTKKKEMINSIYYQKLGILYNWKQANKCCPEGWHLPSDKDWFELEKYLGSKNTSLVHGTYGDKEKIGTKLKGNEYWISSVNEIDNNYGFKGLPSGNYRVRNDDFFDYGRNAIYWSSTLYNDKYAWARALFFKSAGVNRENWLLGNGFSVRCVQDSRF